MLPNFIANSLPSFAIFLLQDKSLFAFIMLGLEEPIFTLNLLSIMQSRPGRCICIIQYSRFIQVNLPFMKYY